MSFPFLDFPSTYQSPHSIPGGLYVPDELFKFIIRKCRDNENGYAVDNGVTGTRRNISFYSSVLHVLFALFFLATCVIKRTIKRDSGDQNKYGECFVMIIEGEKNRKSVVLWKKYNKASLQWWGVIEWVNERSRLWAI